MTLEEIRQQALDLAEKEFKKFTLFQSITTKYRELIWG